MGVILGSTWINKASLNWAISRIAMSKAWFLVVKIVGKNCEIVSGLLTTLVTWSTHFFWYQVGKSAKSSFSFFFSFYLFIFILSSIYIGENSQILCFGKICDKLALFWKYLAIYHFFSNRISQNRILNMCNMIFDIMKIEYFFVILKFYKVKYLVFLFFPYFLYLTDFLTRFKAVTTVEFSKDPS